MVLNSLRSENACVYKILTDVHVIQLSVLGRARLQAATVLEEHGEQMGMLYFLCKFLAGVQVRDPNVFNFLWVEEFPLFSPSETDRMVCHESDGRSLSPRSNQA